MLAYGFSPRRRIQHALGENILTRKHLGHISEYLICPLQFWAAPSPFVLPRCLCETIVEHKLADWTQWRSPRQFAENIQLLFEKQLAETDGAGPAEHLLIGNFAVLGRRDAQNRPQTSCVECVELAPCSLVRPRGLQTVQQTTNNTCHVHPGPLWNGEAGVTPYLVELLEFTLCCAQPPRQLGAHIAIRRYERPEVPSCIYIYIYIYICIINVMSIYIYIYIYIYI